LQLAEVGELRRREQDVVGLGDHGSLGIPRKPGRARGRIEPRELTDRCVAPGPDRTRRPCRLLLAPDLDDAGAGARAVAVLEVDALDGALGARQIDGLADRTLLEL